MSRVTSKFQVSIPRELARAYGIRPGDELHWEAAGEALRVYPKGARPRPALSKAARLRLFDETTAWLEEQQRLHPVAPSDTDDRGWTREDIYRERLDRLDRRKR